MKITQKHKKGVAKVAKKHDLDLVVLFGSQASGSSRVHARSDLDIAVRPIQGSEKIHKDFGEAIMDLQEVFPEAKIDLSSISRAGPLLLHGISKDGDLLFGKERDFEEFKLYAFHRYQDYQPYFHLEAEAVREQIHNLD